MRASSRSLSLDPVELLTYQGIWELVDSRIVAVVGTRNPTGEGVRNTDALVRHLVASGLAAGIDTAAHRAAIDAGGHTIAVIGTPLGESSPRENAELQTKLAREHLVVSQVPIEKYAQQTWRENRLFFPARNVTMSALSEATIIVEAGPSSGTLIQARAALAQRRPLFILASCFDRPELTWPRELEQQGAVRLYHFEQLRDALAAPL